MIDQTDLLNLDICGLMVDDRLRDSVDCPCEWCEGILFEAWERMTYGGVQLVIDEWWASDIPKWVLYPAR